MMRVNRFDSSTRMRQAMRAAICLLVLLPVAGAAPQAQGLPDVVALDLDFSGVTPWWTGDWDIGAQINELWRDELSDLHRVRVLDPKALDATMKDWGRDERRKPTPDRARRLGADSRARFILAGEVLAFGMAPPARNADGTFTPAPPRATAAIRLRLLDAASGAEVAAATGAGEAAFEVHMLERAGEGQRGRSASVAAPFVMKSPDFTDTPLGRATAAAIRDAARTLVAAMRQKR